MYPQPEEFMPECFLDPVGKLNIHGRDPADVIFGFGRMNGAKVDSDAPLRHNVDIEFDQHLNCLHWTH